MTHRFQFKFLALFSLVLLSFTACTVAPAPTNTIDAPEEETKTNPEGTVQGIVLSVDLEHMMVDAPAIITLELADQSTQEIRVAHMGYCKSQDIADVYQIQVGDKLEVYGSTGVGNSIIPCESEEHFLRVIE